MEIDIFWTPDKKWVYLTAEHWSRVLSMMKMTADLKENHFVIPNAAQQVIPPSTLPVTGENNSSEQTGSHG